MSEASTAKVALSRRPDVFQTPAGAGEELLPFLARPLPATGRDHHVEITELRRSTLVGAGDHLLDDEEHALRAGHVVARPPGTGIAHAFRAETELTMLSYGTREPNDITYYPRSDVFALRGIKLIGRLERLAGDDVW